MLPIDIKKLAGSSGSATGSRAIARSPAAAQVAIESAPKAVAAADKCPGAAIAGRSLGPGLCIVSVLAGTILTADLPRQHPA